MWYLPSLPCLISSLITPFCTIFAPRKFVLQSNFSCSERRTALVTSALILCCCWFVVIRVRVECTWTAIFMHFGIKQPKWYTSTRICLTTCTYFMQYLLSWFFGESTILHQVMIVFIKTLSLHVIFLLLPLCRTKSKGNKRSLWRRGMFCCHHHPHCLN